MNNRSEPVWPGLLFLCAWWKLSEYPQIGDWAFPGAIVLCWVGWIATRMFSGAVHRLAFWGWVLLIEVAVWYSFALWVVPLHVVTRIFLLWGIATPLLLVGHTWRRAHDRFPALQGVMHVLLIGALAAWVVSTPVFAWHVGPDFWHHLIETVGFTASGWLCLWYGWRLAAPAPSGEYDARLGSVASFQRRGVSYER